MVSFFKSFKVRSWTLIVSVALFLTLVANIAFFKHVIEVYPLSWSSAPFIVSLALVLMSVSVILLSLFSFRRTLKPVIILILILSSFVAYFMDTYNTVIDTHMIQNTLETNLSESSDLFSFTLVLYVLLIGVIPSFIVYNANITPMKLKATLVEKGKIIGIALAFVAVLLFAFSKNYTSFFREHKPLRYYANPAFYLYSSGSYIQKSLSHPYTGLALYAQDAVASPSDKNRKLIVVVVGEAARWDHFSLNGYSRETNPLLKNEDIVNFSQFTSCGTETAISVPCMFSSFGREKYEGEKAKHTENILDVLKRSGANILWRDNNSDSKGVAERVTYEDYKIPANNTICEDGECRDEGMLVGLDTYIKAHPKGDIVIVLHQMGNHGPAYYKRYPKEFEKFTPVCKSNQLEQCTQAEIANGYDNVLLYTDYFLKKTIDFLKTNDSSFATAMFYVSDHGESLGENGLYLHGFPYAIAPEAQKHVPAVMWFGKKFKVNKVALKQRASKPYSQDFIFDTLLGMDEVKTSFYRSELDILHGIH